MPHSWGAKLQRPMQVSLQAEVRGARGGPPNLCNQLRPLPPGVRPAAARHELDRAGAGQDEQDHHPEKHQGREGQGGAGQASQGQTGNREEAGVPCAAT